MKYKAQLDFIGPVIFGGLLLFSIWLFVISHNWLAFSIYGGVGLVCFILTIAPDLAFLKIQDGVLSLHFFGTRWQVQISEIAAIDDVQGKVYLRGWTSVFSMRRAQFLAIGFVLKTNSGKILVSRVAIRNYPQFLTDLLAINPAINVMKLTESLNQPIFDQANKPL